MIFREERLGQRVGEERVESCVYILKRVGDGELCVCVLNRVGDRESFVCAC